MSNGNCSFCGKRHDEVYRLITSDGCKICNECVGRCCNMIADELKKSAADLIFLPPAPPSSGGTP
jgi:ATP-dependent protease Clp ATPase subunit